MNSDINYSNAGTNFNHVNFVFLLKNMNHENFRNLDRFNCIDC